MPIPARCLHRPGVAEVIRRFRLPACLAGLLSLLLAGSAVAVTFEPLEFRSEEERALYLDLVAELRCLVCQNQNLAESDAELAGDLRAEVYRLIGEGAGEDEIVAFMVDRYGDFVLYRPPLKPETLLLWAGPFVLALGGMSMLVFHLRRRDRTTLSDTPLNEQERAALARLVDGESPPARRD